MKETVIFNGSDYFTKEACDEAAEFLKETNAAENPNYNDCCIFQSESMNIDFEELQSELSMNIGREIIGLATVKVWNGYRKGAKRFSENLSDILYEQKIDKIKNHVFISEHELLTGRKRFDPSYEMAQSWQRLINGDFKEQDIVLLKHEYAELRFMEKGYSQNEAHILASKKYNYAKYCE